VIRPEDPLAAVRGVGPRRAAALEAEGLRTVEDLLLHLPRRYEDRSAFLPIASLVPGLKATVRGRIVTAALRRTRSRGFTIFEAVVEDDSAPIRVIFFNQPYLRTVLTRGREIILYGEATPARFGRRGLVLESPQCEIVAAEDAEPIHMGRVVPIHPRLPGMSSRVVRSVLHRLLADLAPDLPDPLPAGVAAARGFPPRRQALLEAHFPPADTDPEALRTFRTPAHRRLIFEEFFFLQLAFAVTRREAARTPRAGPLLAVDDALRERLRAVLPFPLTAAQRRALGEIGRDLLAGHPMNRLLQGDVGCGKTVVALLAMLLVAENGMQAAFMAPTEILAEQQHRAFQKLLAGRGIPVGLLTASVTGGARRQVLNGLRGGGLRLVVGTHALAEEEVAFQALRLVVIDEQHRFGVMQRARLRAKGSTPDVLVMTATPIPRSLALTVYGDLDISVIDALPPGRRPVTTVLREEAARLRVYEFVRKEVAAGRQAYIVYPIIEESESLDLKAATAMAERLGKEAFPGIPVGLLHGRLKSDERDRVMGGFAGGRVPVLVATTIVEVGIDVPNATVMVIEQAERFGLSQLHQLRGRVGRGEHPATCVLLAGAAATDEARRRLEVMTATTDGFEVARRDLEIRGPGQFFGTRQSGLADLRVGDILRDREILEEARALAFEAATATPGARAGPMLDQLRRRMGGRLGLSSIG